VPTPRKSGLVQRWLKNPVIIAAAIGAIGVISAALIQRTTPKPKLAEPMKIEQTTHGAGSPAIGQVGGSVTILQQERGENP
jgi:hypothetical protein